MFSKTIISVLFLSIMLSCQVQDKPQEKAAVKTDPLPSWNEGAVKSSILTFVTNATDSNSDNFIPVAARVATFDNDGTLWSEQPLYFQFYFALDRVKELAPEHPEWKNQQPFKAVLENDFLGLMMQGSAAITELLVATHTGMTTDEFDQIVKKWISTAKHPTKNTLFTNLRFQPMMELLDYLRANDFKVFIVSGGGIGFMRAWTEDVYGIPNDQVVGSAFKLAFDYNNGNPVINRLPELTFYDDKEAKPVGIEQFIGKKPVFAAGNSDGDLQMLQWSATNTYSNFQLYVHHTDSVREWAYDRNSHIGKLDKGLDEAVQKKWAVVDMAKDWNKMYPANY